MKANNIFILLSLFHMLFSCSSPSRNAKQHTALQQLEYANKFEILKDGLKVIEPWPGAVKPKTYWIKEVPKRIVVTSTTHLPYLELLGLADNLVGFPNTQYISSPTFRKRVEEGKITDLGPDGNINLELLIALQPDVVIAFDMGNESTTLDKIEEAGIPVVYNADYLETSALGRAEWIKFFGKYFQKEQVADSVFSKIKSRYDSLKQLVSQVSERPTVFSGVLYGDTWFLPGGQNWAAGFYKDAGGTYLWADNSSTGWLEVSFESVFDKASQADFWIGTSTFNTRDELAGQDSRYEEFTAFPQHKIYSYNKRISETGGYDFFESGYARPDIVLADLIRIIHPELLVDYETYYFQKLP